MRTIAFITLPAYGHIAPMLATATQLVQQGDKVVFFTNAEFYEHIQSHGFEVINYADFSFQRINDRQLPLSAEVIIRAAESITDQLLVDIKSLKPDLIIRDITALWGKVAGEVLAIPTIVSAPIAILSPLALMWKTPYAFWEIFNDGFQYRALMLALQRRLGRLTNKYHIPRIYLWQLSQLVGEINLVFTYKQLQPLSRLFSQKKFIFIPNLAEAIQVPATRQSAPHIYISMGTFYSDDYVLFHKILTALKNQNYRVTVSTGGQDFASQLAQQFPEFSVHTFLDQAALLPKVDLIIFSGGMNTTREAIRHGIPMIIIPLAAEQRVQASQVSKYRLGVTISRKALITKPELLSHAVKRIFQNRNTYTARISKFAGNNSTTLRSAVSTFI